MQTRTLARSANADGETRVSLEQCEDGGLQVFYHDVGAAAQDMFGDGDYEAWLKVPQTQVARLCFALLAEKFDARADALTGLRAYCEANGVEFESGVWT